jgi:hypothetical protein
VENEIQIVDTHKSLITLVGIGFAAGWLQLNRTLVTRHDKIHPVNCLPETFQGVPRQNPIRVSQATSRNTGK